MVHPSLHLILLSVDVLYRSLGIEHSDSIAAHLCYRHLNIRIGVFLRVTIWNVKTGMHDIWQHTVHQLILDNMTLTDDCHYGSHLTIGKDGVRLDTNEISENQISGRTIELNINYDDVLKADCFDD